MSELLKHWLRHYDSIHRGWTPGGIANGVCATNGFAFPRVAGGYNLYRSMIDGSGAIEIAGAADAITTSVETFAWAVAGALDNVRFEIRSIGGGGVESASSMILVDVEFDALAQPNALKPNAPRSLSIVQRAAGRFELAWRYVESHQPAAPVVFRIFSDNASGVIDYGNAVGEVTYRKRGGAYSFVTSPHVHGVTVQFAVRAFTASDDHDGNEVSVSQWADALPPGAS